MKMIGSKVLQAFNEQILHEQASSHIYLAMAADFHYKGFDGMAQWFKAQAREEEGHALKFFDHIKDRGGKIELEALPKPKIEWASPLEAFEDAYRHEQFITAKINDLVSLAASEKDNAAAVFLQWFVTEQVEEEAQTSKIVQTLKIIGNSGSGLVMLDHQLGKRT